MRLYVTWQGRFRPPLTGQGVFPRPHQEKIPIWLGVGGTPQSFVRAGALGLPLMVAIIGGDFDRFRPLVDLYREAGRRAGHPPEALTVGVHAMGFVGDTDDAAKDAFFPGWAYMFTEIGRERGWSTATRAQFEAMCGRRGAFLIGAPKTIRNKILNANAALGGVSRITFQMSSALLETEAMQRSIELLGTEVAPAARRYWVSRLSVGELVAACGSATVSNVCSQRSTTASNICLSHWIATGDASPSSPGAGAIISTCCCL